MVLPPAPLVFLDMFKIALIIVGCVLTVMFIIGVAVFAKAMSDAEIDPDDQEYM